MDIDPASLDPELRTTKFLALMSTGLGLFMRVLPLGRDRVAIAGVALCAFGLLISVVYTVILAFWGRATN